MDRLRIFRTSAAFLFVQKGIRDITVISDSTIGFWGDDAIEYMVVTMAESGVNVRVDAKNGSGCVASGNGRPFGARIKRGGDILFVGGWNDSSYEIEAVRRKISLLRRYGK